MEYELTRNCRFGKAGRIVSYGTYLSASRDERATCFKPFIKPQDHYNASESHGVVSDDDLIQYGRMSSYDTDNCTDDTTSSVSSSISREDNFDFGGGSFGGGGASSDYEDSGYGSSSDSGSSYDSGSSDSGSSDYSSS